MGIWTSLFKKAGKGKKNKHAAFASTGVAELFEELNELFVKKKRLNDYNHDLEKREEEIKKFQALDKEDVEKLNIFANQAKEIAEKKQNLRGRLIKNNKSLFIISQYEEELPELIKEMYESEKKQKQTETHIIYLQEEKEDLLEERDALLKGYHFLKTFSILFVIIIAVAVIITCALMQMLRDEVWIYLGVFGSMMVVFLAGILYAKDRMDRELNVNVILQQKAVRYLNKSKIKYFHQTRYLNFQYEKLGVDSAAKLEMYYSRYIKNKDNEKKFLLLNEKLSEIEEKMMDVLKKKNIHVDYIENLSEWAMAPKKVNAIKALQEEKQKVSDQLQALNSYEESLWKEIFVLKEDEEMKKVIEDKIDEYHAKTKMYLDKIGQDA